MALYVTGDTHGKLNKFVSDNFKEGKNLTKDDYVVILGDFGLIWDYKGENSTETHWLDWLNEKPWTTLFLDGNHENFDRLDSYPVEDWHGGKVSFIRPSVIHLKRGYVFDIDGCKCYCMGGAASHDIKDGILEVGDPRISKWKYDYCKFFRVNKVSWWEQEIPNTEELQRGLESLAANSWEVDFIFSHCASVSTESLMRQQGILPKGIDSYPDALNMHFQEVEEKTYFKRHYFGHYHYNVPIQGSVGKQILLYDYIERIN